MTIMIKMLMKVDKPMRTGFVNIPMITIYKLLRIFAKFMINSKKGTDS